MSELNKYFSFSKEQNPSIKFHREDFGNPSQSIKRISKFTCDHIELKYNNNHTDNLLIN
jgi:hypothetical protein